MHQRIQDVEKPLYDPASERLALAGLLKFGESFYFQIDSFLKEQDFYLPVNQTIYHYATKLIKDNPNGLPSIPAILAQIDPKIIGQNELPEYLQNISNEKIQAEEAINFSKKVAKYALVRNIQNTLKQTAADLNNLPEEATLRDIIIQVESPLAKFTSDVVSPQKTINLIDSLGAFIERIPENKNVSRGIPSAFSKWGKTIGGGYRKPGVHLLGARSGQGKSFFAVNEAFNCVQNNVPIIYLDTELSEEITLTRLCARISAGASGTGIDEIESGKANVIELDKIAKTLKGKNFHYHNISGTPHSHWISEMRKWVIKHVGFNPDGSAKDCLIILDYIKIMDLSVMANYKEYQYLGQIITDLHNFCIQYNVAILCLVQLNREGINTSGEGVLADSDRLLRLCSSFSIFRKKEEEDYAADPVTNGNRKLITVKSRFGAGMEDGEYINLKCDFARGLIEEGNSNLQNRIQSNKKGVPPQKLMVNKPVKNTEEPPFDTDDDLDPIPL